MQAQTAPATIMCRCVTWATRSGNDSENKMPPAPNAAITMPA